MIQSTRKLSALIATGIFSLISSHAHAVAVQFSGNGHWYEAILTGNAGITWTDANIAATARGGYLATITSADENNFVYGLVANNSAFWLYVNGPNSTGPWLGGYQKDELAEPTGHWAWVTGETWSYTNWVPGEPNNYYLGEDYLNLQGLNGHPSNLWNDSGVNGHPSSGDVVPGYIVEFNANPNFTPLPSGASMGLAAMGAAFAALVIQRLRAKSPAL